MNNSTQELRDRLRQRKREVQQLSREIRQRHQRRNLQNVRRRRRPRQIVEVPTAQVKRIISGRMREGRRTQPRVGRRIRLKKIQTMRQTQVKIRKFKQGMKRRKILKRMKRDPRKVFRIPLYQNWRASTTLQKTRMLIQDSKVALFHLKVALPFTSMRYAPSGAFTPVTKWTTRIVDLYKRCRTPDEANRTQLDDNTAKRAVRKFFKKYNLYFSRDQHERYHTDANSQWRVVEKVKLTNIDEIQNVPGRVRRPMRNNLVRHLNNQDEFFDFEAIFGGTHFG